MHKAATESVQQEFLEKPVLLMMHTHTFCSFSNFDSSKVFLVLMHSTYLIYRTTGYNGSDLQHQNLSCISSPQFLLLPLTSLPPSLSVLSLFFISDPFFMHYSITLNSHLQCITSSHLSQTHFLSSSFSLFSHFASLLLPHFPALHHDTFPYFSTSLPLLSLCLFSGHVTPY